MKNNNQIQVRKQEIRGESSWSDKCAFACDVIMLSIFLVNHIFYKTNMLFLIILLVFIGILIFVFGIIPDNYCFTDNSLEIVHRFQKKLKIPYETIFNYEETKRDSFINILQSNTVKVYYKSGKKKKLVLCRPCDVDAFVDTLKNNCSEFHEEGQKSNLDVFFHD